MSKEKMGELKIKLPQCWIDALREIHAELGWDLEKECRHWMIAGMQANMSELDHDVCNRILRKHNAENIDNFSSGSRVPKNSKTPNDKTAKVPDQVKPEHPWGKVAHLLTTNTKFQKAFQQDMEAAQGRAFIKAFDILSPDEKAEILAASSAE